MKTNAAFKTTSLIIFFLLATLAFTNSKADLSEKEVKTAMKIATDFMMTTVSNRGGVLWKYSADLSEQWGEVPARKSQIWVQPPGTASVGTMLLQAFRVTFVKAYYMLLIDNHNDLVGMHILVCQSTRTTIIKKKTCL